MAALDLGSQMMNATSIAGRPLIYAQKSFAGHETLQFNPFLRKAIFAGAGIMGAAGVMNAALTYQDPVTRTVDMSNSESGKYGHNYGMAMHYNN